MFFKDVKFYLPFIYRVIGYIKNGWVEDFIDKWKQTPPAASSCKQTVKTETNVFPVSANWIPLREALASVPSFNMQNVTEYFIERKAKDNECN